MEFSRQAGGQDMIRDGTLRHAAAFAAVKLDEHIFRCHL